MPFTPWHRGDGLNNQRMFNSLNLEHWIEPRRRGPDFGRGRQRYHHPGDEIREEVGPHTGDVFAS
jgi:hypothetical protein